MQCILLDVSLVAVCELQAVLIVARWRLFVFVLSCTAVSMCILLMFRCTSSSLGSIVCFVWVGDSDRETAEAEVADGLGVVVAHQQAGNNHHYHLEDQQRQQRVGSRL